jgi:hypothetical protein
MASTHKSLRSSTANKRPTTAIADGQIALNTNATSPGLFFKDSTGATIIKIGPVHVGTTAPNATPGSGGSTGNSTGEVWLDTSLTPVGVKIWDGTAWANATPSGSTTVQGLLELATNAETQTGSDTARAVTPAGLQSKLSDSATTTSSTTIASSTAVKAAYDLAAAAVPLTGGTVTGNLEIGTTGSLSFEGATADGFETTIAVVDPTADRTITLPNITGTVVLEQGAQTVQFGLGAAATPSVTFTGDPNTGIYSPGADQLAISTGGTGRLFVDASGNVGIGAASTNSNVLIEASKNVAASYASVNLANLASNGYTQQLFSVGSVSGSSGQAAISYAPGVFFAIGPTANDTTTPIVFRNNNATERIRLDASGGFQFKGAGTAGVTQAVSFNGSAPVNSLVIDSSGRLGVGTSNPTERLTVGGNTTPTVSATPTAIRLDNTYTGSPATNQKLKFYLYNDGAEAYGVTVGDAADFQYWAGGSATGIHRWFTSNTERARIESSGRLLVGTSTARGNLYNGTYAPSVQFETSGNLGDRGLSLAFNGGTTTGGALLAFITSRGTTAGSNTIVANGDELGGINFTGTDGTKPVSGASINAYVDGTPGANDMPGRLVFSTTADGASSPTTRMTINSAGNISIGTTSDAANINANCVAIRNASGSPTSFCSSSASATLIDFQIQGGTKGSISATTASTSFNTSSDYRLKENVVPLTGAVDRLNQLQVHRFNFIAAPDRTVDGFIAHEAQAVVPECVTGTKDEVDADGNPVYQGIDQSKLVPLLTAALQEAIAKIETLEAKVAALEGV